MNKFIFILQEDNISDVVVDEADIGIWTSGVVKLDAPKISDLRYPLIYEQIYARR